MPAHPILVGAGGERGTRLVKSRST
jgi:hypothetical protein